MTSINSVENLVANELFPHVVNENRGVYLMHCMLHLITVALGIAKVDNRDDFTNKKVDTCGPLIALNFRQLFKKYLRTTQTNIAKTWLKHKSIKLQTTMPYGRLTNVIHRHFRTGNWSVMNTTNGNTGVVQILIRTNRFCSDSQLKKKTIGLNKLSNLAKPPKLNSFIISQFFLFVF